MAMVIFQCSPARLAVAVSNSLQVWGNYPRTEITGSIIPHLLGIGITGFITLGIYSWVCHALVLVAAFTTPGISSRVYHVWY